MTSEPDKDILREIARINRIISGIKQYIPVCPNALIAEDMRRLYDALYRYRDDLITQRYKNSV